MLLDDEATWPSEVVRFIGTNEELFDDWHGPTSEASVRDRRPGDHDDRHRFTARQYDRAILELAVLLKPYTLSPGYHCTRLTDSEIAGILRSGMQLQNGTLLRGRIRALEQDDLISPEIARSLSSTNQADDSNRAGKIWFCFFPPKLAGENGIGRFFRHWGGEALYNSHEDDSVTSPILRRLGTPAVIEADVPIASLNTHSFLSTKIVRRYFVNRGGEIREGIEHAGYSVYSLPAQAIRRIIRFPDSEFINLTQCNTWRTTLT